MSHSKEEMEVINMEKPFRNPLWQKHIKEENMLTPHEFCMSMTDANGTYVKLDEVNEMIRSGVLTIDFEKLEQRIFDKTVIRQ